MSHETDGWPMHPPIGRPIWNTRIYLLDERLRPAAVGVPGELYIAGVSLARGYLNRPDLTAEKFVPDPYGVAGERLYRTGDLARYKADGEIEYLGRLDQQVKIRGYRVEPGEIESVLSQHEAVVEVAVVVREDQPGRKRLVAYLVCDRQPGPSAGELQKMLRDRLPDYMIPSAFVVLDRLPLTPNGKVDRRALPQPDQDRRRDEYVAPRTQTEEMLAAIWAEVLEVKRVGRGDNFFELGGHSLLATQVVSRIRKAFEVALPLRVLFESATLGSLATAVDAARQTGNDHDFPPVLPVSRDIDLPLSFSQQRLWFIDQLGSNSIYYNLPFALRLTGQLAIGALERGLEAMVSRHESLRTSVRVMNGRPVQHISPAAPFRLPVVDLSDLPDPIKEACVRKLASEEANTPFDLERGPLFRAVLLRLGEREHAALFTMHHIITDGWSIGVFIRDMVALYEAFASGNPSPLATLPVQYADYAFTQREWLQGEVLETQLAYWRQQLADDQGPLRLPLDRPRLPARSYRGAAHTVMVDSELSGALKAISRRQSATLYMTLLAAYNILLHFYSEQNLISVGSPIANRRRVEIEELIGFFVNMLVLRTNLDGDPTFLELVARVRKAALDAYAHQDLPFERLVEELHPERSLSYAPLFQAEFTLQNTRMEPLEFSGVTLAPLNMGEQEVNAQFDLMLDLYETADGLSGSLRYSKELFNAETTAQIAAQFERIIRLVAADPDIKLSVLREHFDKAAEEYRMIREAQLKNRFAAKLKTAKRRTVTTLDPATTGQR
jgi:acyl carrier protein